MNHEANKLKIIHLKKRIQRVLDANQIVRMVVDTVWKIGNRRVRYYDVIYDPSFKEILLVGRYSRGMNLEKSFYGYKFYWDDKYYIRGLIKSKNPRLLTGQDVLKREPTCEWVRRYGLEKEQFIDIPLVVGKELVGLIAVDNKGKENRMTDEDLTLLTDVARLASVAISNARSRENFSILNEIGAEAMRRQLDRRLLRFIVKKICKKLNAQMSSVFLYDEVSEKLIRRETYIDGCRDYQLNKLFEEEYGLGANLTGYAFKMGKPLNVVELKDFEKRVKISVNWTNVRKYQRFAYEATGKNITLRNAIFAPLMFQNRKIGIIRVANNLRGELPFPNSDLDLLRILANQIALIIRNALSFQSREHLSRKLELLSESNDKMLKALWEATPRKRLNLVVEYASKIMEAENTALFLVKKRGKSRSLDLVTEYGNPIRDPNRKVELPIRSKPLGGLTGHAAMYGRPIRLFGDDLVKHWAVRHKKTTRRHLSSKKCVSFLTTPLRKENRLVGLLKSENKYRMQDSKSQLIPFSKEDVNLSQIFANKIVLCLDLAERQSFLNSLLQETAEPFVAVDSNGKVEGFNRMAEKLLGWKENEITGKSVVRLHKDRASAKKVKEELRTSKDHKVRDLQISCRHKSGRLIPISLSAALLLDERDEIAGSIGVFRDLRELRKNEEEERMAVFGTITGEFAHDIKGFLVKTSMISERLLQALDKGQADFDQIQDFLEMLRKNVQRSNRLLNWMKQLPSHYELKRGRVNLNNTISSVLIELLPIIRERNVRIIRRIPKSIILHGDSETITRVFKNIFTNALESMKKGGAVRITVKHRAAIVSVYIQDSGTGISQKYVERIFDPFCSTKRQQGNLGLGLFFCKYMVQLMGGDVYLAKTSSRGSTFVVELKKVRKSENKEHKR